MKNTFILLFTVMLLVGSLVWAGGEKEAEAKEVVKTEFENSWENYKDEPITLTVFADGAGLDTATFEKYDTLIPQLVREETGVTLEFEEAVDSSDQSLNLLIASGDYPDIMFIKVQRHTIPALSLIENDQIWAFNDLKEKYGIDTFRNISVNQRFYLRSLFGKDKIFYLTTRGIPEEHMDSPWLVKFQSGTYINENLYKAVGFPPVNSFEDLMNVAEKIKAQNPRIEFPINVGRSTGKGKFNEAAEFNYLKMYYGLNDPTTYWKVGGKHKFYFQAPAFLDLLKDFNEMYNRGLISPIIWTGSKDDKMGQLFSGTAAITLNNDADNLENYSTALQAKFPDERYIMLPAYPGRPKYEFTAAGSYGRGGQDGWCIPKGGKNTLRALAMVDYLMSDHFQLLMQYGREGKEHDIVDGTPVLKPEIAALPGTDIMGKYYFNPCEGAFRNDYWAMVQRQQRLPSMLEAVKVLKPAADKYKNLLFVPEAIDVSYPEGSEELKIYSVIRETFGDELTRIVQGPPERVESDYRVLLAKIEEMGLSKLNAFQQKAAEDFAETVKKYKY